MLSFLICGLEMELAYQHRFQFRLVLFDMVNFEQNCIKYPLRDINMVNKSFE